MLKNILNLLLKKNLSVKGKLAEYANSPNISKFGSAVKFSQVVGIIDDSDNAITSSKFLW